MSEPGHAEVMAAIDTVLDPCSVFNGTRLSLIELGMVERVTIEDGGRVHILLFLDDPTCMLFFEINRMLDEAVSALPGVTKVAVEIKADEIWTEDRMTTTGRTRLEAIRAKRRQQRPPVLANGGPQ
jgi:metal-sulfur cluster biosynthetic enzyme